MNTLFVIAVGLLIGIGLISDYKQINQLGRWAKWTYWGLLTAVAYIVIARKLGAQIDLPTEFFVHSLSPLIQQYIP